MRRKTARADDFRVRVTSFGNALGNSIVGAIEETPAQKQAQPQPTKTGTVNLSAFGNVSVAGDLGELSPVPALPDFDETPAAPDGSPAAPLNAASATIGPRSGSAQASNLNNQQVGESGVGTGVGYARRADGSAIAGSEASIQSVTVRGTKEGFWSALWDDVGDGDFGAAFHLVSKRADAAASWAGSELEHVAHGAVSAAVNLITQPVAQLHDLGAILYGIGYNATHADTYQPNWWSSIGQQEMAGNVSTGQRLETLAASIPIANVGVASYELTTAAMNGDWGGVAEQIGALGVGLAAGKVVDAYGNYNVQSPVYLLDAQPGVMYSNPIGLRSPLVANPRDIPGTAFASGELSPASGTWLDPAQPAPIPSQVAEALSGQKFGSFGDLRAAIWQTIAGNDELNGGFSPANLAIMAEGNAPFAPRMFQTSELSDAGLRFNLHHIEPIGSGGSVYDLSNLQIVSPSMHYSIHYGP